MVAQQQEFYTTSNSKETGKSWASKLIKNSWTIIYTKWEARNEKLHDPPTISKMEGIQELKEAICQEMILGLNNLPL